MGLGFVFERFEHWGLVHQMHSNCHSVWLVNSAHRNLSHPGIWIRQHQYLQLMMW